jgi:hypothetical protein
VVPTSRVLDEGFSRVRGDGSASGVVSAPQSA